MIRIEHDGVEFWCIAPWDSGGPGLAGSWRPEVIGYAMQDEAEWSKAHLVPVDQWLMEHDTTALEDAIVDAAEAEYEEAIVDRRLSDAGY